MVCQVTMYGAAVNLQFTINNLQLNLMKILQFLTLFLVFAIPLYPLQLDTRIIFVIAGFSLLLYRVFIKNFTQDLQEKNLVTIFFLLFLGALTLSTIFSIDRERSLFYLLLYFSCFVIFTSIRSIFPTQKSKILLVTCYLLPVTILSAISLYNTVIINYVNREPIGTSFMWIYFGHNHLSALLIFAVPLSIFLLKTRPLPIHSTFYILHSTFLLTALFFTFGLTSIVALAASGIVTSLLFWETSHIKKTAAGLTILVAFGAFFFGTTNFSSNFDVGKNIKSSFKGRIIYWQNALNNFKKSPLLGTGLNTFRYFNPVKKNRLPSLFTHNFFLQMLTDP